MNAYQFVPVCTSAVLVPHWFIIKIWAVSRRTSAVQVGKRAETRTCIALSEPVQYWYLPTFWWRTSAVLVRHWLHRYALVSVHILMTNQCSTRTSMTYQNRTGSPYTCSDDVTVAMTPVTSRDPMTPWRNIITNDAMSWRMTPHHHHRSVVENHILYYYACLFTGSIMPHQHWSPCGPPCPLQVITWWWNSVGNLNTYECRWRSNEKYLFENFQI